MVPVLMSVPRSIWIRAILLFDAGGAAVTSAGNNLTITTTNTASGGFINNATTIGANSAADDAALETAVAELTITASNGAAYISEADAIELQGIAVGSNTFGIHIESAGTLSQTATGISATSLEVSNSVGTTTPVTRPTASVTWALLTSQVRLLLFQPAEHSILMVFPVQTV